MSRQTRPTQDGCNQSVNIEWAKFKFSGPQNEPFVPWFVFNKISLLPHSSSLHYWETIPLTVEGNVSVLSKCIKDFYIIWIIQYYIKKKRVNGLNCEGEIKTDPYFHYLSCFFFFSLHMISCVIIKQALMAFTSHFKKNANRWRESYSEHV